MEIIEITIRSVDLVDKEIDKHGRKNLVCTLFYLVSHELWLASRSLRFLFLFDCPSVYPSDCRHNVSLEKSVRSTCVKFQQARQY